TLALQASAKYLARRGTPRALADLAGHDCILFRAQNGVARWTLSGPAGTESVEVRGPVTADDFAFVRKAALAGGGIAFMPVVGASRVAPRAEGRLVRVLPQYTGPSAAIHVVSPSSRFVPRRVTLFREALVDGLLRVLAQG